LANNYVDNRHELMVITENEGVDNRLDVKMEAKNVH